MNPIIPLLITLAIVSTLANIFNGIDLGGGTLASTSGNSSNYWKHVKNFTIWG
jgi:hypothetical protein